MNINLSDISYLENYFLECKKQEIDFIVTNVFIASDIQDLLNFINQEPILRLISQKAGEKYLIGNIYNIQVFVDPNLRITENIIKEYKNKKFIKQVEIKI